MAIEQSPLPEPRVDDDESIALGEEEVGPAEGLDEPTLEPGDEESWLDAEPDADVEAPRIDDDDDDGSALDDAPLEVEDDPLEVGDETRWTEGSEADESMEHAVIEAPDDEAGAADDGAEGIEGEQVEPGFGEGDVAHGSDDADDELAMGALDVLDEADRPAPSEGLVGIGSHEGEGVEVWPDRVRIGRHELALTPPIAGAIVLDDERLLAWTDAGGARLVRLDEPGERAVLDGVRLAVPDGRGGALIATAAGAVVPLVARGDALCPGPVRVTLAGLRSFAAVGGTTFLVGDGRLFAADGTGALEPVATPGTPLVIAADARGRLLLALGLPDGVAIERWAIERGGKRERLGRLDVRPSDVGALAALDRGVWVLVGTRRITLLGDPAVEAG